MDTFQHKTIQTKPLDLTYSYYLSRDFHSKIQQHPEVPVLVLFHGFPDDSTMWSGALPTLTSLPYPIILVDILGLGQSSKPLDPKLYNNGQQADSIVQILDEEGVGNHVIPIGHDWGSSVAQRFYLYKRHRCIGLALLSLPYQLPNPSPIDLDQINKDCIATYGYPNWEYWHFFTHPDAPRLLREHADRFFEVNNGLYPSPDPAEEGRDIWMREMFCKPDTFMEYMTKSGRYKDYTVPLKPYPELEKHRKYFIERLQRDGLDGAVHYYTSRVQNTMVEDEKALCEAPDEADMKITDPLLYIGQTGDWVCRWDGMKPLKEKGYVTDLEEHVVQAGHWVMYEKPQEIADIIAGWLTKRFPVSA